MFTEKFSSQGQLWRRVDLRFEGETTLVLATDF